MLTDDEIFGVTGSRTGWSLTPVRGGFQGVHFILELNGRRWFVKVQPDDLTIDHYEKLGVYEKEPRVYNFLLPAIQEHIESNKKLWPRVYLSRNGAMVLEDLTSSGWSMSPPNLGELQIRLVLQALADFHAASMDLDTKVSLLESFPEALRETYFGQEPDHPGLRTWISFSTNTSRKIFQKYFGTREWSRAIHLMGLIPSLAMPSKQYRNCVCHGDPWLNNIFFQHLNGIPVAACFVDFAQVRFCPPAFDVLLFLYILQLDDIQPYILFYHASLQKHIPDFTIQELEGSFEVAKPFALCLAALYIFLTRLPETSLAKITISQDIFWEFAFGKHEPAMEALESNETYRAVVLRAYSELLNFTDSRD